MIDYNAISTTVTDKTDAGNLAEEIAFTDALPRTTNKNGLDWITAAQIIQNSNYDPDEKTVNGFSKPINMIRASAATVIKQELIARI